MTTTTFSVPGIGCATCKKAIERALAPAPGVAAVEVDLAAKTVAVCHDKPATVARLIELIEGQGYDVAARC
ncbi:heavy-metal-associated domain-containing protein [[Mycobacterium] nativiensis]|uniref:Heavy-metal-associated domain-containing protein n=1 Tax=[Mycobacterium] nativiensis TaxID=2855503 RepID=A0ABU5Y117_9MYCO|nr:heavy-metal-associated domain-containing protein [Mycolicibacter sp. MYC340]MEB3033366.1 heavy-metal-associated domain-containing protein [Mycolicibacter sp. MYC340]